MEEKKELKPEIQVKPKIKYDYKGKVFEDEDQVAFFKHENLIHKLQNKLLGDFDEKGLYTLPKEILKDLLALKKVISKRDGKYTYLKANCGNISFYFEMEIGEYGKGISFAQILLIEQASYIEGDEKFTIKTPIVFYTDDTDVYFETKVKKIFNILSDEEVEGKEKENDVLAIAILEKIKLMQKHYDRYLLETRLRDKIYVEKVLAIFAQDLLKGPYLLKKYESILKKYGKQIDVTNKNYYRVLKLILDQILFEEEKSLSKEIETLLNRLRKVYVQANTQTIEVILVPKKVEVKKEEVIKAAKGPGAISFKYDAQKKAADSSKKKYRSAGLLDSASASSSKSQPSVKVPESPAPQQTIKVEPKTIDSFLDFFIEIEPEKKIDPFISSYAELDDLSSKKNALELAEKKLDVYQEISDSFVK